MGGSNISQDYQAFKVFGVTAGSFLGQDKLPQGLVFFAPVEAGAAYTCELNGIATEEYAFVFRKGSYYVRFFVFGKEFHTEVIEFIKVDMPSNEEVMDAMLAAEMVKVELAIANAINVTAKANLEFAARIEEATKNIRALIQELDNIKQNATDAKKWKIQEAIRKANKPIQEAIRKANKPIQEAKQKANEHLLANKSLEERLEALKL
jgi:hypothetical protein